MSAALLMERAGGLAHSSRAADSRIEVLIGEEIGTISPALLPYHILKEAGYEHPYYTGFLGRVQERYDIIDRYQLIRSDGNATTDWSRKKTIDPLVRDYRFLQHDIMFGKRRGLDRFFPAHAGVVGAAS